MADELTGSARSAGTTLDSCKVADVSRVCSRPRTDCLCQPQHGEDTLGQLLRGFP